MWGTYWVWDARHLCVRSVPDVSRCDRALAHHRRSDTRRRARPRILTLVGAINIPIIKFSVDWWNTLHQPASVVKMSGPAIHPTILLPLLVMAIAFTLLFIALHLAAMRNEILKRRIRSMHMMQADAAPGR